jgi:hypothetical protein
MLFVVMRALKGVIYNIFLFALASRDRTQDKAKDGAQGPSPRMVTATTSSAQSSSYADVDMTINIFITIKRHMQQEAQARVCCRDLSRWSCAS